jgi:hypothetical protein
VRERLEDEKYAPWSFAQVFSIYLHLVLIKPLGFYGVAMGTMLAQMLTSNWYAVYRPLVRLKLNFSRYLRTVVSSIVGYGPCWAVLGLSMVSQKTAVFLLG